MVRVIGSFKKCRVLNIGIPFHLKTALLSFSFFFSCSPTPTKIEPENGASSDYVVLSPQASLGSEVAMETGVKCRVCGLPADAIFEPCGHVVACMECATMLKKCFRCKVTSNVLMLF